MSAGRQPYGPADCARWRLARGAVGCDDRTVKLHPEDAVAGLEFADVEAAVRPAHGADEVVPGGAEEGRPGPDRPGVLGVDRNAIVVDRGGPLAGIGRPAPDGLAEKAGDGRMARGGPP